MPPARCWVAAWGCGRVLSAAVGAREVVGVLVGSVAGRGERLGWRMCRSCRWVLRRGRLGRCWECAQACERGGEVLLPGPAGR